MVALAANIGRFVLLEVISNSGLAVTYRALDTGDGREVALKVLHRYFEEDRGLVERYFAALQTIRQWQHVNILPVLGFGEANGVFWVAFPFVPAGSLKDQMHAPYTVGQATAIAGQVAHALEFAHQRGVFHRNLKPGNVLLAQDGTVYLTDFGSATLGEGAHPLIRSSLATPMPAFMSPEQAGGDPLDPRSEGFAVGSLVYWMITGEVPFPGNSPQSVYAQQVRFMVDQPSRLNPDLPRDIDRVVLKALAPFPDARYQRGSEFVADLAEIARQNGDPVEVPALGARTAASRTLRSVHHAAIAGDVAEDGSETAESGAGWRAGWSAESRYGSWWTWVIWLCGVLVVAAAATWYSMLPPPKLDPASSSLSSASPAGLWTMPRHDLTNSAASAAVPSFKGEVKWRLTTGAPIEASATATENTVYITTGDHRVLAVDAASGAVRWELSTPDPVSATPVVAEDWLYVGLRDGRLLALDARDGTVRWELATGKAISSAVTVAEGVVYVPSSDGTLYTYDAVTGERRWSFSVGGWITAPPAVWPERVAVGSREGWVYVLDSGSGENLYDFRTFGPVVTALAVLDHRVYVGSANRRVWALDTTQPVRFMERVRNTLQFQFFLFGWLPPPPPSTGLVWRVVTGGRAVSSAALSRGMVVVGNEDGKVHAWSTAGGEPKWEFSAGAPVLSDPSIAGDTVYVGSDSGKLFALELTTGQKRWEVALGGRIRTSPAPTKHGLYVTAGDTLYALR